MYKPNPMGPWPIIDLAASKESFNTTAADTAQGLSLRACLNAANLGSSSEGFMNMLDQNSGALASGTQRSYGVVLEPLINADIDAATYVDISIDAIAITLQAEVEQAGLQLCPFIGEIDSAATLGANFAAGNVVDNYNLINLSGPDGIAHYHGQVLLNNVVSSAMDLTNFTCVGFTVLNATLASKTPYVEATISARYATRSFGTSLYRG